ncbi:TetR/AcrR family transcriptional regulator [Ramlibacter sp.]|uniref:TetR/AcrR family transcriptional regulator n=1 Tax=Ramlibacter sp. TaxID=1917967 RepID=UPI003D103914
MPRKSVDVSPPVRKTQDRSTETRMRLVECAIECLAEMGYAGATTPVIAERANVTRGALQYHFASRTDLDMAVIDHVANELNFKLDAESLAGRPIEERVRQVIDTYWATFSSRTFRAALHIWLAITNDPSLAAPLRAHMQGMSEAIEGTWGTLFNDLGRTPEELRTMRHVAMGAARGFAVELIFHPGEKGVRERELLTRMVMSQLQPVAPGDRPARASSKREPARTPSREPTRAPRRKPAAPHK